MDENKRARLHSINYEVKRCCSFCSFSSLTPLSGKPFGTCTIFSYAHLKHGNERALSVSAFGVCPYFKEDRSKTNILNGFSEFME